MYNQNNMNILLILIGLGILVGGLFIAPLISNLSLGLFLGAILGVAAFFFWKAYEKQ
ncbi:MAG: hypothetical protein WCV55_01230 [Candidatus Paceibacterota bacterium]